MEKTTSTDVIAAHLANIASQRESSPTKKSTSSKDSFKNSEKDSPKKPSNSQKKSVYPKGRVVEPSLLAEPNMKEEPVGADERLTLFMNSLLPMRCDDGTEHFYNPEEQRQYTLQEIAGIMGVTRERVRQIEEEAKKKLFAYFCSMARREGDHPLEWATEIIGGMANDNQDEYTTSHH